MVLPKFVSLSRHVEKTYEMSGLINWLLEMDKTIAGDGWWLHKWCFNIYYYISTTSRVPTSYSSTVPAAHEPGTCSSSTTTSTVVRPRPRTSCGPVAQHLATEPRLRPSFFVHRERTAISSFVLLPSRWPTPAGRRGHVRTAVLSPRFAHATPVRYWHTPSDIIQITTYKYLHSVGIYIRYILIGSTIPKVGYSKEYSISLAMIEFVW